MFARYIEKNYYKFTLFAAQEATSGSSHQWSDWCGAIPTILSPRVSGDLRQSLEFSEGGPRSKPAGGGGPM